MSSTRHMVCQHTCGQNIHTHELKQDKLVIQLSILFSTFPPTWQAVFLAPKNLEKAIMEAIIYRPQFHASLGCFAVPPGFEVLLRFQLKGTIIAMEHILFGRQK